MSAVSASVACIAPSCSRQAVRTCPSCGAHVCRNHSRMLSTMDAVDNVDMHRCSCCERVAHLRAWLGLLPEASQ